MCAQQPVNSIFTDSFHLFRGVADWLTIAVTGWVSSWGRGIRLPEWQVEANDSFRWFSPIHKVTNRKLSVVKCAFEPFSTTAGQVWPRHLMLWLKPPRLVTLQVGEAQLNTSLLLPTRYSSSAAFPLATGRSSSSCLLRLLKKPSWAETDSWLQINNHWIISIIFNPCLS